MPVPGVQGREGGAQILKISSPYLNQGGRSYLSHYCSPPQISRPSDIPDWRNEVVHIRSQASYDNFNLGFGLHHDCIITINFLIHDGAKPFIISYLKYLYTQHFPYKLLKESIIKVFS